MVKYVDALSEMKDTKEERDKFVKLNKWLFKPSQIQSIPLSFLFHFFSEAETY